MSKNKQKLCSCVCVCVCGGSSPFVFHWLGPHYHCVLIIEQPSLTVFLFVQVLIIGIETKKKEK